MQPGESENICIYSSASTPHYYRDDRKLSDITESKFSSGQLDSSTTPSTNHLQGKHHSNMRSTAKKLSKMQMYRNKYFLNYFNESEICNRSPTTLFLCHYMPNFCRWKYLRWLIIFVASTLLFFGLINFCIWLHDLSVAHERYLLRSRQHFNSMEAVDEAFITRTIEATTTKLISATSFTSNNRQLQESTNLRGIVYGLRDGQNALTAFPTALSTVKQLKHGQWQDSMSTTEISTYAVAAADLVPKNVLHVNSFNGNQKNFAIPFEKDEHISRLYNSLLPLSDSSSSTPQIDPTVSPAIVSPTIPSLRQLKPTPAMNAVTPNTAEQSGCYSTSLSMCQSALSYDLTYNSTAKLLPMVQQAFENLLSTNCSIRAREFICIILEPECQPKHIGILPPCRRLCKAILEACSIVIANWDILNEMFDCSLYPDSNDVSQCVDPTRRFTYCYENEFKCSDNSCIPHQWQCDNIKDCDTGEDEESCLVCEHQDEFRCRSNEKCIPEIMRCDSRYDCVDGSDEDDCEDFAADDESTLAFDEVAMKSFPLMFSYASIFSPNQSSNERLYTYITEATDDESSSLSQGINNRSRSISKEEETNSVPDNRPQDFGNFRDSKEVMITSDTENKLKYSATTVTDKSSSPLPSANFSATRYDIKENTKTTTLQPAETMLIPLSAEANARQLSSDCAAHQLRCVSGECIAVHQLCDKKIDCPDGADEIMCIYTERKSSTITRTSRKNVNR